MAVLSYLERFGMHLAELRRQKELTQEDLAELAGCSVDTVSFLERGGRKPSFDLLLGLAQALEISVS